MRKLTFVLYTPDDKNQEVVSGVIEVARWTGSSLLESAVEEIDTSSDPIPRLDMRKAAQEVYDKTVICEALFDGGDRYRARQTAGTLRMALERINQLIKRLMDVPFQPDR